MQKSIAQYEHIEKKLVQSLEETSSTHGISLLRLLINRVQCSILHIQTILSLSQILSFADDLHPERLSENQKTMVRNCCYKSQQFAMRYVCKYLEQLPDRGCQGIIVSYWATIPVFIDHVQAYFVEGEKECHHQPLTLDSPPPPDTIYLMK